MADTIDRPRSGLDARQRLPQWLGGRANAPLRRDLIVVDLERAMEQAGCPVCHLARKGEAHHIGSFLHESVNDPGVRDDLRDALGFCPRHTWLLHDTERERWHDGLGTAIVLEDMLREVVQRLQAMRPRRRATVLEPRQLCPACRSRRRGEGTHLRWLARHLGRPAFRALFVQAGGLCVPHLQQALAVADDGAALLLTEVTAEALTAVHRTGDGAAAAALLYGLALDAGDGSTAAAGPDASEPRGEASPQAQALCPLCALFLQTSPLLHLAPGESDGHAAERAKPGALERRTAGEAPCGRHARLLVRLLNDPAHGSAARQVIAAQRRAVLRRLGALQCRLADASDRRHGLLRRLAGVFRRATVELPDRCEWPLCPACERLARAEATAIEHLGAALASAERRRPLAANAPMCLPHLRLALGALRDEPSRALAGQTCDRLERLRAEVREYTRKHAWQYRDEPKGEEQTSWTRATRFFAGERLVW